MLNLPCEKLFNDAFLTGELNLRCRQLSEFPHHYTDTYNISDLVAADLSQNCLCELPICICDWRSLETLQFRSNGLRSLPASIGFLQSLNYLDLSENNLAELPSQLFALPLKILLLSSNRLEQLPTEIRQLGPHLQELDVGRNRLKTLPSAIALLTQLRVLNVRSNQLKDLPNGLGCLTLRVLDVSSNLLIRLPMDLCQMSRCCVQLNVAGNPLMEPPLKVVAKGRGHIFKWLSSRSSQSYSASGYTETTVDANGTTSVLSSVLDFARVSTLNATIRRSDRSSVQRNSDVQRRTERRSRSIRSAAPGGCSPTPPFNGTDSGYVSTGDELINGNPTDELLVSRLNAHPSTSTLVAPEPPNGNISPIRSPVAGGELVKEIMMTYEMTKKRPSNPTDQRNNNPEENPPPNRSQLSWRRADPNRNPQTECLSPLIERNECRLSVSAQSTDVFNTSAESVLTVVNVPTGICCDIPSTSEVSTPKTPSPSSIPTPTATRRPTVSVDIQKPKPIINAAKTNGITAAVPKTAATIRRTASAIGNPKPTTISVSKTITPSNGINRAPSSLSAKPTPQLQRKTSIANSRTNLSSSRSVSTASLSSTATIKSTSRPAVTKPAITAPRAPSQRTSRIAPMAKSVIAAPKTTATANGTKAPLRPQNGATKPPAPSLTKSVIVPSKTSTLPRRPATATRPPIAAQTTLTQRTQSTLALNGGSRPKITIRAAAK